MDNRSYPRARPLRLRDGGEPFLGNVGPYWSEQNAQFESTNPNFAQRVVRQVNPVTGFGSNLGQLHDAVSNGQPGNAAMAVAQSAPGFAAMRSVVTPALGLVKAGIQSIPSLRATAAHVLGAAAAGAAVDDLQAEPLPPKKPIRRQPWTTN